MRIYYPLLPPLGLVSWNVVLPRSVSLLTELSGRREIDWRLFGHSCTIAWFDCLVHLQPLDNLDIVCRHLPVAPSTFVIHAVGRRDVGSGRARARPQPVPMNLLRPASLPLPRQRCTSSGGPAAARLPVASSVVVLSVT